MEKCPGDAGSDGNQFLLPGEDFNLAGAGEFGKVYGAAAADVGRRGFVGGDRRQLWKKSARVDEEIVSSSLRGGL